MRNLALLFLFVATGLHAAVPGLRDPAFMALLIQKPLSYPCSYDFCEGFENPVGYEQSGWTENLTVINEDYTGVVPLGIQSLLMNPGSSCQLYRDFTAYTEVFFHFQFRVVTAGAAFTINLRNGTTDQAVLNYHNGSTAFWLSNGDGSGGSAFGPTVTAGTTYHIWLRWKKGTGTDGIFELWQHATAKPGSPDISKADGTWTSDFTRFHISIDNPVEFVFDDFQVDATAIP